MSAQRIAGWIAAVSGSAILVLALIASVAGAFGQDWATGSATGYGMMGGAGMMGGTSPSMMGAGHPCSSATPTK